MIRPLIHVVIVEDQPDIRADIKFRVERLIGFKVIGTCGTVREARGLLDQTQPDLLLLDVHLPDGTGFDVLKDRSREFKIIFLTGFEKHAIQAIKYGAHDYLLKPFEDSEFSEALSKVSEYFPAKQEQLSFAGRYHSQEVRSKLVLRNQDYLKVVEISQIVYLHSTSGYVTFHFNDGKKMMVTKILSDYEDILTEPSFFRPHQSYLLNTNYIDGYSDGFIHLKNGDQIPVAVRRKEAVKEFFNRF